jgi:hypothetical protein
MNSEPYVSATEAAKFLSVERRFLLSLARKGLKGSYPIGTGDFRKRWVFKLSELEDAIDPKSFSPISSSGGKSPQSSPRYDLVIRRPSLKRG